MSKTNFIAGALVGLVAGLLIAPQKGEELREDLTDTAIKWKKKLNKMANKATYELSDIHDILQDEIEGMSDDIRHRMLTVLNEA